MTPTPCDQEVFQNGTSLLAADTSAEDCRAVGFEKWVKKIAEESGQKVDWHYSGGVAHMLYIGDKAKIVEAMQKTPCPARIMRFFDESDAGLYRNGVTPTPPGAVAAYYEGGRGSTFIIGDE